MGVAAHAVAIHAVAEEVQRPAEPGAGPRDRGIARLAAAEAGVEFGGKMYGDLKKDLAEVVADFVTPFRDRTLELLEDEAELDAVLWRGAEKAGAVAERTLADVYDRVGFVPVGR